MRQYTVIYTKEPEWWYTVEVVDLPWCVSYGKTLEQAQENIKDAINGYLVSTLPMHLKDISIWTLKAILRQTGLTIDDMKDFFKF